MQIPENPKNICTNLISQGKYKEELEYLRECNFSLIKFIGKNDYLVDNCCSSKIYLGRAFDFNDCFDCCWTLSDDLKDTLKLIFHSKEDISAIVGPHSKEYMDEIKKHTFISSFSEKTNLNNPKMWYMYASQYQGACLEYNISDIAVNLTFPHNPQNDILLPITYTNHFDGLDLNTNPDEGYYNAFGTKSIFWKDEKEWRIIRNDAINNHCFFSCKPKAIYLGANIDSKNRESIIDKYDKTIKIYDTFFDYFHLNISYKPI